VRKGYDLAAFAETFQRYLVADREAAAGADDPAKGIFYYPSPALIPQIGHLCRAARPLPCATAAFWAYLAAYSGGRYMPCHRGSPFLGQLSPPAHYNKILICRDSINNVDDLKIFSPL
jgi:hypothetical protein